MASGPFDVQPSDEAGKAILADMEKARKTGDLPALRAALTKARSLPGANTEWIDNAFEEIDMMVNAQTSASKSGKAAGAVDMASRKFVK